MPDLDLGFCMESTAPRTMSMPTANNMLRIMSQFMRPASETVVRFELSETVYRSLQRLMEEESEKGPPVWHGEFTSIEGIPVHVNPEFLSGMWKVVYADGHEVWHVGTYQIRMPSRPSVIPAGPVAVTNA